MKIRYKLKEDYFDIEHSAGESDRVDRGGGGVRQPRPRAVRRGSAADGRGCPRARG